MARKFSDDLLFSAVHELLRDPARSRSGVAAEFGIKYEAFCKAYRNFKKTGEVRPTRQPREVKVSQADLAAIGAMVIKRPEAYLSELREELLKTRKLDISDSELVRCFKRLNITRKRLHHIARERSEAQVQAFRDLLQGKRVRTGVWLDEVRNDRKTAARHYGRAVKGQRCDVRSWFVRGRRYSTVAVIGVQGVIARYTVRGAFTGAMINDFAVKMLIPAMKARGLDCIFMDNCGIHSNTAFHSNLIKAGIDFQFLPAYSPDMNPIEECFSKIKYWIRRHGSALAEHGYDEYAMIYHAFESVTPEQCVAWIEHSGYDLSVA